MRSVFKMLYPFILISIVHVIHGAHVPGDGGGDSTLNIGLLLPFSKGWTVGRTIAAAVRVGINKVNQDGIISGYSLNYDWRDTHCLAYQGLTAAMDIWSDSDDLDVFIGGGCSSVCEPLALVAAVWNLPHISWGCNSADLSDKHKYPTFTRTVGPWVSLAPMIAHLMTTFGWKRAGILATTESVMQLTANAFRDELHRRHLDVFRHDVKTVLVDDVVDNSRLPAVKEAVELLRIEARIVILLMGQTDIDRFLIYANQYDMLNGEYVFISIDADLGDVTSEGTQHQEALSKGYQGFISCNLHKPPNWQAFAQAVVDEFPNFNSSITPPTVDQVNVHAAMLHDAVLMWAIGVNKTINDLGVGQLDNGQAITSNLIGSSFQGVSGTVIIDENGDRKPDYSIQIWQNDTFATLLDYISLNNRLTKIHKSDRPGDWSGIYWAGHRSAVPKGEPDCGWDNEHCSKTKLYIAIGMVCLAFVIVGITVVILMGRRILYEREIHDQNLWKISWNEVQRNQIASQIASQRATLTTHKTMHSLGRGQDSLSRTIIAGYKGDNVAVKQLNRSSVDTNHLGRNFLVEMKNIRDLNHENVNKFIGVCTEAPNVCILMVYCSRGSLQEVLLNESFNITNEFKVSLASDVAKGMHYLHKSPLTSHGSLTSRNVVVDSRWVAKVTDFGFSSFKEGIPRRTESELWTAPELLRKRPEYRPFYGTRAGDVYSFGIIVSEILTRDLPFAKNQETYDLSSIIESVKSGRMPNCRPVIPPETCSMYWTRLMHICWTEVVLERPNFKTVKEKIKEINGGREINVTDNMLNMLEQHSEQLEEVLEEKSVELECVRQNCESLLLSRVPRDIMTKIQNEEVTDPETFQSATILQTGIHNFEKLVQLCPPTEICQLLSDLWWKMDSLLSGCDVFKNDAAFSDCEVIISRQSGNDDGEKGAVLAKVALKMLCEMQSMPVPALESQLVPWKASLHSGECVGMTIGEKTPRYSVVGKAVATTTRLYKDSKGLRILVSDKMKDLLQKDESFQFELHKTYDKPELEIGASYWLSGLVGEGDSPPGPKLAVKV